MPPKVLWTFLVTATVLAGCSQPVKSTKPVQTNQSAVSETQDLALGKAGLWEMTITDEKNSKTPDLDAGGVIPAMQICTGENGIAPIAEPRSAQNPKDHCAKRRVTPVPGGQRIDLDCTIGGKPISQSTTITGQTDTRINLHTTTRSEDLGVSSLTAKYMWIGVCPARMKPGQTTFQPEFHDESECLGTGGCSTYGDR